MTLILSCLSNLDETKAINEAHVHSKLNSSSLHSHEFTKILKNHKLPIHPLCYSFDFTMLFLQFTKNLQFSNWQRGICSVLGSLPLLHSSPFFFISNFQKILPKSFHICIAGPIAFSSFKITLHLNLRTNQIIPHI